MSQRTQTAITCCLIGFLVGLAITFLFGCRPSDTQPIGTSTQPIMVKNNATANWTVLTLVEVGGHRFLLVQGANEAFACEVTDASKVEAK